MSGLFFHTGDGGQAPFVTLTSKLLHTCRFDGKLLLAVFHMLCYNKMNYADNRDSLSFYCEESFCRDVLICFSRSR